MVQSFSIEKLNVYAESVLYFEETIEDQYFYVVGLVINKMNILELRTKKKLIKCI